MKTKFITTIFTFLIIASLLPVSVLAADNAEAMYADSFERVTDYAKFASNNDSLKDTPIWIEGRAIDYDKVSNSIIVKTSEGNWAAYCGDAGSENFKSLVTEAVGRDVRVFGKYNGVSPEAKLPRIDFIQSDIFTNAYRLETTDNDFRISYPDYVLEVPALDTENTYRKLTYKASTRLTKREDDDTIFYYFSSEIPVFILIHEQELTNSIYDGKSDEEILNNFENYYNMNSKYVVRKERTNIGGTEGIICESSFVDKDMPSGMCLYCYMTIIDRHYYYFGFTQPYLASETVKRFIPSMLQNAKYDGKDIVASKANVTEQEDVAVTEEAPVAEDEAKTEDAVDEEVAQQEIVIPENIENSTEDIADQADAETKPVINSNVPTAEEVAGHYTMTFELVSSAGKTLKKTGDRVYWGPEELKGYDQNTGVCTITQDGFNCVITFEYDKDKNVVCHGSVMTGEYVGSTIGKRNSD